MAKLGDLPTGPRRIFDQPRAVVLRVRLAGRFDSILAMLSSNSRRISSAGTVGAPAASSARLSSKASLHSGWFKGRDVSSMGIEYAPPVSGSSILTVRRDSRPRRTREEIDRRAIRSGDKERDTTEAAEAHN